MTNSFTATEIADQLSGEGVEIQNVSVNAHPDAWGYYYSNGTEIGTSEGLILSTGRINNAIGPNNSTGLPTVVAGECLDCDLYDLGFPGSPLLNIVNAPIVTFDAAHFQFDIVPQGDSLKFNFTFASEEYLEWVGSPFNDVFGFFISGPNVGTDVNIALIPNTSTPVAINSVNHLTNTQYFFHNENPPGQFVQYDGFTVGLTAKVGGLIPCEVYTLKLIIADGSDRIYDSAVFVEKIESNPVQVITATAGGLDYMIEGCNQGTITFQLSEMNNEDVLVTYWVGGTAIGGVDYVPALGTGSLIDPLYLTIPAGQQSVSITVEAIADGIDEDDSYIAIYLVNPFCTNASFDSILFYIQDFWLVNAGPPLTELCIGDCVDLTTDASTDGFATFFWSPAAGLSDPNSLNPTACPSVTTTYTITSQVSDCIATDEVVVEVTDIQLELVPNEVNCENAPLGTIFLNITGTAHPVSIEWVGPNGFTSSDQNLSGLFPGEYCVTVTDDLGCVATTCATVIQTNELDITSVSLSNYTCAPISCFGACDGAITVTAQGGFGSYTVTWNGIETNDLTATGLCAGVNTVVITDEAGCVVSESVNLLQPDPLVIEVVGVVNVLCNGEETGLATVTSTGGCTPYFYNWSHDPALTAPVATNLGSGVYTVTVSDVNGCTSTDSAEIEIGEPGEPITVSSTLSQYPGGFNISCAGASDGSIDLDVSGGTPGYTFAWFDTNFLFVSNTQDLVNVPCGTYFLTITDSNGCVYNETFVLTCPPPIVLESAIVVPNPCDSPEAGQGSIDITVSGGFGDFSFEWNGPSCSPCTTEDISGLNSGSYNLTVTDLHGCSLTTNFNVGVAPGLTISGTATPVTCNGGCDGSIDLTVSSQSGGPYNFSWTLNGNFFSDQEDLSGLCAGIYAVTVSEQNCVQSSVFTILQPAAISIQSIQTTPNPCDQPDAGLGAIDVVLTGGTGALSVEWNGPSCAPCTGTNISGLNSGVYTLTVTDEAGCTFTSNVTVPNSDNILVTGDVVDASCAEVCDGSITILASSPTNGPFDFEWTFNGNFFSSDQSISNLCSGSYQVTVSEDNCVQVATFVVNQAPPITLQSISSFPNPCNSPDAGQGSLSASATGGTGTLTYTWTGPGCAPCIGSDISGLDSGTYDLTITDESGCELTTQASVGTSDGITIDGSSTPNDCFGSCNGTITVSASSTNGGPYSFSWELDGAPFSSEQNLTDLCAGTYVLTVSEFNCVETATFTITQPPFIDIDPVSIVHPLCFGQNNGSITVTASGGVGNLTFEWLPVGFFPGSNSTTITDLFDGTYTVIVTDETGCSEEQSFTLVAPTLLDIFVSTTQFNGNFNISCFDANDGQISVTVSNGTPPYTYDWSQPGCDQVPNPDGPFQDNLSGGTYCVVVTDDNGCIATTEIPMLEPEELIVGGEVSDYNGFGVSCFGSTDGFITPGITGGNGQYISYIWTGPIGANAPDAEVLTNLGPGTYTLQVIDTNGCEDSFTYIITEPEPVLISVIFTQDVTCNGANDGIISVDVTGGTGNYDLSWTDGQGNEFTGTLLTNLPAGTYILTATDENGCQSIQAVTITEPDAFTVSLFSPVQGQNPVYNIACIGDSTASIIVTIEGGVPEFDWTWTGSGVNQSNLNQSGLGAGVYCIEVVDDIGCEAQACIVITEPEEELNAVGGVFEYENGYNISCNAACDGSIDITAVGGTPGYTFIWVNSNGDELGFNEDLTDICAGGYSVLITDSNGCSVLLNFDVEEPDPIVLIPIVSDFNNGGNVSCPGASDGSIDFEVQGGSGEYTVTWNPAQADPFNLTGLSPGQYTVTVVDSFDCEVTETYSVLDAQPIQFNPEISNVLCNGAATGSISANPIGGTGEYTITWDGLPDTTSDLTNLEAGVYTINVVDSNGCEVSESFVVNEPPALNLSATSTVAICGANDGTISLTVSGGTQPYGVTWTGPTSITDNNFNPTALSQGVYTAIVTDANGCSETTQVEVEGSDDITVLGNVTHVNCHGDSTGEITISSDNATGEVTVLWFDQDQNEVGSGINLSGLPIGTYSFILTDELGCSALGNFTVSQPDSLWIEFDVFTYSDGYNVSDYNMSDGSIDAEVGGGVPPYEITWTGPTNIFDGDLNPNNLSAGNYVLTVIDQNGCVIDTLIVLTQPDDIRLPTGFSPNGDGINDNYVIPGLDQHPENEFKVFNRWGNLVYNRTNYNNEWFGQNNAGENLVDGTYFVLFESKRGLTLNSYVDLRR